jgi:DNA-binding transcriptional regulator YhcF (GntR family)
LNAKPKKTEQVKVKNKLTMTLARKTTISFFVRRETPLQEKTKKESFSQQKKWSDIVHVGVGSLGVASSITRLLKLFGVNLSKKDSTPIQQPISDITEIQIQGDALGLNLSEYQKFQTWVDELEELLHQDSTPLNIRNVIAKRIYWIKGSLETFSQHFRTNHSIELLKAPAKIAKYSNTELALAYIEYVKDSGKTLPSQLELADHTGISQPTWNRAYSRAGFWVEIHRFSDEAVDNVIQNVKHEEKRKDTLIQAMRIAEDKMQYYTDKKDEGKRKRLDSEQLPEEVLDIDERLDNEIRMQSMSKQDLITTLLVEFPDLKTEELERMSHAKLRTFASKMLSP